TLSEEQEVSFLPKPFTLIQLAEKVKQEMLKRAEKG
ncbi:two-component system, cell cycle sensor histidine kinase and response regulator CckA, partial [Maricaulis salignorans]